jgi:hypothetical protein
MSHRHCRLGSAVVMLPAVAVALAGLTGCASSGGQASDTATAEAGTVQQQGPLTAAKLRDALLTKVNGQKAAVGPTAGVYGTLPEVKDAQQESRADGSQPKACVRAGLSELADTSLTKAPASSVTFRVGQNAVSETLIAPTQTAAATLLATTLPKECAHYTVTVGGKAYDYSATESAVGGIGDRARAMSVTIKGQPADTIWSVLYQGDGFVGALTVVGPNASEPVVRELGLQAYGFAAKALS